MSLVSLVWLGAGLSLLLGGAFVAIRGASRLGEALRLSPTTRGLVPIAFAASLPELSVAVWATGRELDLPALALGDAIGGVVANFLLALAVAALALPLVISPRLLRFAFPLASLASLASLATLAVAWTGEIASIVGVWLLLTAVVGPVVAIVLDRRDATPPSHRKRERSKRVATKPAEPAPPVRSKQASAITALSCFAGAAAIYFGTRWLLIHSPELADVLRLDEATYGLTVLALVTTLPEAVACLILTLRGDREGAVGVVIGSSLLNLTAALGLAAMRSSEGLEVPPVVFELAIPIGIAAALACVPSFYGMRQLSRASGLGLFAFFVAYFVYATVGENWYRQDDPVEAQETRFYAMFLIAIGLIVVLSAIAMFERLAQKARLADE
ncbi:MAG TPA: hypothetical protein VGN57_18125 [Pirellulaceae bacterium]|jgi:cation:H+ antiporter|nr:hypothetical protein [Pirellulaceae bacterium]